MSRNVRHWVPLLMFEIPIGLSIIVFWIATTPIIRYSEITSTIILQSAIIIVGIGIGGLLLTVINGWWKRTS